MFTVVRTAASYHHCDVIMMLAEAGWSHVEGRAPRAGSELLSALELVGDDDKQLAARPTVAQWAA